LVSANKKRPVTQEREEGGLNGKLRRVRSGPPHALRRKHGKLSGRKSEKHVESAKDGTEKEKNSRRNHCRTGGTAVLSPRSGGEAAGKRTLETASD